MKKIARSIPLVGVLWFSAYTTCNYVYPVGVTQNFDGDLLILSLYQKSPDHTELWQWDPSTKTAERALVSTFTPVGISLLPDNAGFSFFDNGRLRVKHFLKRSPKAIDIYEPLYDIGPVQWITTDLCLFHAKEREKFSLYCLCASTGSVTKIVSHETSDCFYPSFTGTSLFYLERTHDNLSRIMCLPVSIETIDQEAPRGDTAKELLVSAKSLAFLSMIRDGEGLVIEHQKEVDPHNDMTLSCMCYRVVEQENGWSLIKLFSFMLPLSLLLPSSKERLCESIYPLLPTMINDVIYFVQYEEGSLFPYQYTEQGIARVPCTSKVFTGFFTPCSFNSTLIYGGSFTIDLVPEDVEPTEAMVCLPLRKD